MPLPSTPPSGPTRAIQLHLGILPDILRWFHDVHNTEAPLLPRFCELEKTDDWLLGVTKLLELASRAIRCHKGCVSG